MKIMFVIGGAWEVDTLEDIKKLDEWAYDSSIYYLIKALEKNEDFEQLIKKARNKLGIPEGGHDWNWYENIYFDTYSNTDPKTRSGKKEIKDFEVWFEKVKHEANKIYKQLQLPVALRSILPYILIGNFVYPTNRAIIALADYGLGPSGRPPQSMNISIQNHISKNVLIKFIEDNWFKLYKDIQNLPDRPEAYISSRDMMIVELRDYEGLSFNEIGDRVIEVFKINNADSKINEDSIKSAYHRAKAKIAYLGRKKR